jgi:hypothetical protein
LFVAVATIPAARGKPGPTNSAQRKPKDDERLFAGAAICQQERKNFMDYLVVFATMLMIAGYACIIGRCLRGSE